MWLVWMSLAGWSADFDALLSDSGWESVGSKSTNETGPMSLHAKTIACLLYTSPSPRDLSTSRMPSSA